MQNLIVLVLCIFAAVAILAAVTQRFGKATDADTTANIQRWIAPLVGLLLAVSALKYFLGGG